MNQPRFIDPICGMSVDPDRAAGISERDGETLYFCSQGCKARFDSGAVLVDQPAGGSCCAEETPLAAPVQLSRLGRSARSAPEASHQHHARPNDAHSSEPTHDRHTDAQNHGVQAHDEHNYRVLMRKFWFAAAVGLPLALLMLAEFIPATRELLMPYHRMIGVVSAIVTSPVLAWSGRQFFESAWNGLRNHNTNMDTLVALGTGSAWIYSAVAVVGPQLFPQGTRGMYFEVGVIVIALVLLGQALESKAKRRSNDAIRKLLELQAKSARVLRDGQEIDVPIEDVVVGDIVIVRPGEKIPVDGLIVDGESAIDESIITGESIPVDKKAGDVVIGSSINKTGAFRFRATKVGADTALARIVEMVQRAQSSKPPIGRLVDKIASYFVPSVVIIAIATFLLWFNFGPEPSVNFAVVAMVSVLVIACPCALGLATPISLMVGVGKAAEFGVLIRNGDALETASRLTTIVLDKTGTITRGKPELTDIHSLGSLTDVELLRYAAIADKKSEHPLATAIVRAASERGPEIPDPQTFKAIPGYGVEAVVDGNAVLVGNQKLMESRMISLEEMQEIPAKLADGGKTPMYVAIDGRLAGVIGVADTIKEDSFRAIQMLKRMGLEVIMISGDSERTATAIARQVGIDRVLAEVLPEEKARQIKKLQEEKTARTDARGDRGFVGMVGDGINDAPALAQADVGFAIGTGADVAIEAADVTLVGGSLRGVVVAIEVSRATLRNIKQNLFGAFIYNVLGIPIAAGALYSLMRVLLSPIIAGAAMAASSVTVVTNANRLRAFEPESKDGRT